MSHEVINIAIANIAIHGPPRTPAILNQISHMPIGRARIPITNTDTIADAVNPVDIYNISFNSNVFNTQKIILLCLPIKSKSKNNWTHNAHTNTQLVVKN